MDKLEAMKYFVRTVEIGSFSAVAREMNTTQSTVSKRIAALEANLGGQLLVRTSRKITLTEVGTDYYKRCINILQEVEAAESNISELRCAPSGTLRITLPVAFCQMHISKLLPKFMDKYPGIRLEVTAIDRFVDLVTEGVDLAIRIGNLADSSLLSRKLGTSPRTLVASPAYLKEHGTPNCPEELKNHKCATYAHLVTGNTWVFKHKGKLIKIPIKDSFKSNNSLTIREYVLAGKGIAYMPIWGIQEQLENGSLIRFLIQYMEQSFPINAVYPNNRYVPLKVKLFIDFLKEEFDKNPLFRLD